MCGLLFHDSWHHDINIGICLGCWKNRSVCLLGSNWCQWTDIGCVINHISYLMPYIVMIYLHWDFDIGFLNSLIGSQTIGSPGLISCPTFFPDWVRDSGVPCGWNSFWLADRQIRMHECMKVRVKIGSKFQTPHCCPRKLKSFGIGLLSAAQEHTKCNYVFFICEVHTVILHCITVNSSWQHDILGVQVFNHSFMMMPSAVSASVSLFTAFFQDCQGPTV